LDSGPDEFFKHSVQIMYVTAIYSIKGGVGKTATAVNLAALASFKGEKTLLIDLDPQASSTFYLKVKPKIRTTVKKLLKGKSSVQDQIKATDYVHLDILPSTFGFRNLEQLLEKMKRPGERIREMLEPLGTIYQWIFIDCPPGMTRLAEAIFNASDLILVPVVPTTLSVRTYHELRDFIADHPLRPGSRVAGFFSMVERRKNMHREILNDWDFKKELFCNTSIPYLSDVERMGIYRKPVVAFKPGSDASAAFAGLWAEIKKVANSDGNLSD
jgi:chromosome partitioning protein